MRTNTAGSILPSQARYPELGPTGSPELTDWTVDTMSTEKKVTEVCNDERVYTCRDFSNGPVSRVWRSEDRNSLLSYTY